MNTLQSILTLIDAQPYMLKASFILCILYGAYFAYFSEDASFTANRFYLLGTIVLTLFLPLISFDVFPVWVRISAASDSQIETITATPDLLKIILNNSLFILYLGGFVWMIFRLLTQLFKIISVIHTAEKFDCGDHFQIRSTSLPLSSFHHFVFVPDDTTDSMLLDHELIHVRQRHTIDVLIAELFKCFFWFHPLAYSLSNSIKLNHEFECDAIMSNQYSYERYGTLLIKHAHSNVNYKFINQFSSFTKKRIIMMTHQKNNQISRHRHLLMIPALLSVFAFFSFRTYYIPIEGKTNSTEFTDTIPAKGEKMDTIFTIDPVTLKETMTVVKSGYINPQLDEASIINSHPEIITYSDTSYILDPKTYKETAKIESGRIIKGYKMLIDNELKSKNPDLMKIDQWYKKGKQK